MARQKEKVSEYTSSGGGGRARKISISKAGNRYTCFKVVVVYVGAYGRSR